jgi:CRISPR-associated protein Cas2
MNTQFVIVSYDISSNSRRRKVMKTLEGYGERVQFSVFECNLAPKKIDEMRRRLEKLISPRESIRIYFLSADDVKRIVRLGDPRVVADKLFVMH